MVSHPDKGRVEWCVLLLLEEGRVFQVQVHAIFTSSNAVFTILHALFTYKCSKRYVNKVRACHANLHIICNNCVPMNFENPDEEFNCPKCIGGGGHPSSSSSSSSCSSSSSATAACTFPAPKRAETMRTDKTDIPVVEDKKRSRTATKK